MDAARLAAIRAREQAASPGPWRVVGGSGFEIYAPYDEDARRHGALDMFIASCDADARSHPNAAFIAAARADVPDLLAEVERLRAGIAGLRREHWCGTEQHNVSGTWVVGKCPKAISEWKGTWGPPVCRCGADAHNARIDALLHGGHE